jgi:hypothetical protein
MEEYELILQRRNGAALRLAIKASDDGEEPSPYVLEFDDLQLGSARVVAEDFFNCLKQLRLRFEPTGIKVLCNGARVNAVCSGMASQMGGCRKVYLVEIGRPSHTRNLVPIFDEAPADTIGTVSEQDEFRERWIASLRGR